MNKTLTINMSGIIFHIDEFAFDKLKNYLNTIRSYFKDSDGRDEIMADIEARIAEIFSAKTSTTKQVILMDDVDQMIAVMGNPEVFKEEGEPASAENKSTNYEYQKTEEPTRRRIFRDEDDKVLGGVCSGAANYFDIDPLWIRLGFVAAFFYFGTGFLFYLILWAVIPKARTTAEKLEMKGEKVNINTIEKNIKDEMDGIKSRFNENVRGSKFENNRGKFSSFFNRLIDFVVSLVKSLALGFGKFFAVVIIVFAVIFITAIMSAIFGSGTLINITHNGIASFSFNEILERFFNSPEQILQSKIALLLLLILPLVALIYKGLKIIFKIKVRHRWLNIAFSLLWLVGLALALLVVSDVKDDFRYKNMVKQRVAIGSPAGGKMYLSLPNDYKNEESVAFDDEDEDFDFRGDWNMRINSENQLSFYYPKLNIEKSNTDSFEMYIIKTAKGKSSKDALYKAERINYSITIKDSLIVFNPQFETGKGDKWRAQKLKLLLKVPEGKSVYLSENLRPIVFDIKNLSNTYDGDMIAHTWTMTKEGLACKDCGDIQGFKNSKDDTDDE